MNQIERKIWFWYANGNQHEAYAFYTQPGSQSSRQRAIHEIAYFTMMLKFCVESAMNVSTTKIIKLAQQGRSAGQLLHGLLYCQVLPSRVLVHLLGFLSTRENATGATILHSGIANLQTAAKTKHTKR